MLSPLQLSPKTKKTKQKLINDYQVRVASGNLYFGDKPFSLQQVEEWQHKKWKSALPSMISPSHNLKEVKPIDFIFHMFCRNLALFCVELLTKGIPGVLFAYLFLEFRAPESLQAGFFFLLTLFLGYFIYFEINFLMGCLSVVTLDIRSYGWAFFSLTRFASGQLVPLWLFPPFLAAIVAVLPFQTIFFVPMSIYIGANEGTFVQTLLFQLAWFIGLFVAVRLSWAGVQRRLVVQGG